MKIDPTTYRSVHCNLYLTERQKILLKNLAKEKKCPMSELVRQAIHFFLRKNGRWDGLLYSKDEFYRAYLKGREEMARDAALQIDRERRLEMESERERERERQRAKEKEIEERFRKGGPEKSEASE